MTYTVEENACPAVLVRKYRRLLGLRNLVSQKAGRDQEGTLEPQS